MKLLKHIFSVDYTPDLAIPPRHPINIFWLDTCLSATALANALVSHMAESERSVSWIEA